MLNTSQKIGIARALSYFILTLRRIFFLPTTAIKKRNGIQWSLDLKEGIDFAIYLLGGFEMQTFHHYKKLIRSNDIILDIGANIGAHTLPLAKLIGEDGKVIAFEPTQYAFKKLENNIKLNPSLQHKIKINQTMLVRQNSDELPNEIYSSWPLEMSDELHKDHLGRLMSTHGAAKITLDEFISQANLSRLNFIKLDVDGNEYEVLSGGQQTLKKFRPILMMELAPFVFKSYPEKFDNMLKLLWELGYEINDIHSKRKLPKDPNKIRQLIPERGGINTLAICY